MNKTTSLNRKFLLLNTASLAVLIFPGFGQNLFPDPGFLYSDEEVARIDITINPAYLDSILRWENRESDYEYPADFKMTRGTVVETVDSIGFRLRGNTSRSSWKKSFKVSVNSFFQGRTFHEVEKINLNGEHNDPSISRAKICWDMFREAGVPAPRANHVELYINKEYRGLYINVEHIDEEFTDTRFGNNDGNMYKCLWPADLDYLGSDPDLYKYTHDDRRAYELKRNEELDDYSDLALFIDILNNTSSTEFREKLEPVFNINSYLKNLAVEILCGHWDAYSYNKNNYYLYHNEESGKFEFIPYDPDNTFGIDWFGIDWAERDMYDWYHSYENRPLTEKIMENQVYRDRFSFYTHNLLETYFSNEVLDPELDALKTKIAPYIVPDFYRTLDYGYDYNDFYNSFDEATGDHVKEGLKTFINKRNQSALEQLELVNIAPIISRVQNNSPDISEDLVITSLIEDEEIPARVELFYLNGSEYQPVGMQSTENDMYQAVIPAGEIPTVFEFYIEAEDLLSQQSRDPLSGNYVLNFSTGITSFANTENIQAWPNPFSNFISFSSPEGISQSFYRLMDINGREVLKGISYDSNTKIQTGEAGLEKGIYFLFLEFMNAQGSIVSKSQQKLIYIP